MLSESRRSSPYSIFRAIGNPNRIKATQPQTYTKFLYNPNYRQTQGKIYFVTYVTQETIFYNPYSYRKNLQVCVTLRHGAVIRHTLCS